MEASNKIRNHSSTENAKLDTLLEQSPDTKISMANFLNALQKVQASVPVQDIAMYETLRKSVF